MKSYLATLTAVSLLTAFSASAQTTITTTTRAVEPQVVFTPEQTTIIQRDVLQAAPSAPIVLDEELIVGATLPESVILQPVPPTVVTQIPNTSSYRYVVVGNEVVFVDPMTRRVVAVVNQ